MLRAEAIRYRRERWVAPDGTIVLAPLPAGVTGHFGPARRRGELRARFDRIFRRRTGFVTLDRLLQRLHANKPELLMVLDRPEIRNRRE